MKHLGRHSRTPAQIEQLNRLIEKAKEHPVRLPIPDPVPGSTCRCGRDNPVTGVHLCHYNAYRCPNSAEERSFVQDTQTGEGYTTWACDEHWALFEENHPDQAVPFVEKGDPQDVRLTSPSFYVDPDECFYRGCRDHGSERVYVTNPFPCLSGMQRKVTGIMVRACDEHWALVLFNNPAADPALYANPDTDPLYNPPEGT